MNTKKGVIGILTGGGDVPGLNPAIRAVTIRALREGYQVLGIRRGWSRCAQRTIKTRTISLPKSSRIWIGWALTI